MKHIIFIESNTTGTGKLFIKKAIEKGYNVIFLTDKPERYTFLSELMIVPVRLNTTNLEDILSYLRELNDIEAVFSSSEYYIEITSSVAERLKLPGNDVQAIRDCRDKYTLCQKLLAANVCTPHSYLIKSKQQADSLHTELQFAVVLKPVSGSGSVGVKRCDNVAEYQEHMHLLLNVAQNERGIQSIPQVLVQEYIQGPEYSVETITVDNTHHIIGITKKYLGKEPYFIEIGHDFPAELDVDIEQQIVDAVNKALSVMQLSLGAAHVELRLCSGKVYIIEINPRLAGGMIPALIQASYGIDVLNILLDLYCGKSVKIERITKLYSSIRFIIPEHAGFIKSLQGENEARNVRGVKSFTLTKTAGDTTTSYGDYRDRIGYIISSANTVLESSEIAENALTTLKVNIETSPQSLTTGRLNQSLHPNALKIVNKQSSTAMIHELKQLITIDQAHLIMLMKQKIIPAEIIKSIIDVIVDLEKSNFEIFNYRDAVRGTYLLYESVLIEKLGMDIGGVIHTGRSRNDINATLFMLNTRALFQECFATLWQLRNSILQQAERYSNVAMPIYSQFQAALPGNYGYYLLAIESALARDQQALIHCYGQLAICPLGSGAGSGTSFPIDTKLTAKLLGFESVSPNALDAVASRDLAVRLLSSLSIIGMTLSRIAQDYQLWTTQEFSFFDLPDYLVGGSSMMPQKKNPYLLEKIKGKSIVPTGHLMTALATMQKTPFSNSVEVGTEALVDFDKSFKAIEEAVKLLQLIIQYAKPMLSTMHQSSEQGLTNALCVAEELTKSGMAFRESHYKVGHAIRTALDNDEDAQAALTNLLPNAKTNEWYESFKFGGGCASSAMQQQLTMAIKQLRQDGLWMQKIIAFWNESTILLNAEIGKIQYSTN